MHERLRVLMAGVLGIPLDEMPDDAELSNPEAWDSVKHIEIMLAIEVDFSIELTAEQIMEARSLAAIEQFLTEAAA